MNLETKANQVLKIDFAKVKTIEDILIILESLGLTYSFNPDNCSEDMKKLYDSGLLFESKSNLEIKIKNDN